VRIEGLEVNADEISIESEILKVNPMLEKQLSVMLDKQEEQTIRFKLGNAAGDTTDAIKGNEETLKAIDRANNELHEIDKLHKEGKASDRALLEARTNLAILIASEISMALKVTKGVATLASSIGTLGFYISAEVETKVEEIVKGSSAYKFVLNKLNAREIKINVIDGILKGSTIDSTQETVINVEKDLVLESVQDKEEGYTKSNSYGGEIGYSLTSVGGSAGVGGEYGHSYNENNKKSTQGAYLKSGGKLVIRVGGTTRLKGSTISSESGETDIETKSLIYEDIENSENTIETGQSISGGFGKKVTDGTVSIGYKDKKHIKDVVTRATIGKGQLKVLDGSGEGINREEDKTEETRKDEVLKAGDCVLTLDTRLFSTKGREEIKDQIEVKNIWNNLENIGRGIGEKGQDTGEIISKIYKLIIGSSKDSKDIASRIAGANDMYEVVMKDEKISKIEKEWILENEEIDKLAIATSNLEKVEEYIKKNNVSEEVARKLRAGAVVEGAVVHIEEDGKIYVSKFGKRNSYENGVLHLSIERVSNEEMTSKEYLANIRLSDTEEVYISKIKRAKSSIAEILLETRFYGKLKVDVEEVGRDTVSLLMEITRGLNKKEIYKEAFEVVEAVREAVCADTFRIYC
jgi:ribosomal protein L21